MIMYQTTLTLYSFHIINKKMFVSHENPEPSKYYVDKRKAITQDLKLNNIIHLNPDNTVTKIIESRKHLSQLPRIIINYRPYFQSTEFKTLSSFQQIRNQYSHVSIWERNDIVISKLCFLVRILSTSKCVSSWWSRSHNSPNRSYPLIRTRNLSTLTYTNQNKETSFKQTKKKNLIFIHHQYIILGTNFKAIITKINSHVLHDILCLDDSLKKHANQILNKKKKKKTTILT